MIKLIDCIWYRVCTVTCVLCYALMSDKLQLCFQKRLKKRLYSFLKLQPCDNTIKERTLADWDLGGRYFLVHAVENVSKLLKKRDINLLQNISY